MPGSRSHRKEDKNRRAASFHGRSTVPVPVREMLMRPRTVPDLLASGGGRAGPDLRQALAMTGPALGGGDGGGAGRVTEELRGVRPTKLLLNVTVQRSLGALHVLMRPEATVGDLIAAALRQYKKEGRRPVLDDENVGVFDLHYSQFSLESLKREDKLITLGSRNFFLFPRKSTPADESRDISGNGGSISASSCSKQAEKPTKIALPWLKFLF